MGSSEAAALCATTCPETAPGCEAGERVNGRLKKSWGLDCVRRRGLKRVQVWAQLALLCMNAFALSMAQAGRLTEVRKTLTSGDTSGAATLLDAIATASLTLGADELARVTMETAKALDLTIPPSVLGQANVVIE